MTTFSCKYKNLLNDGKSSTLTMRAEAGRATLTLTVEVVDLGNAMMVHQDKEKEREELQLVLKQLKKLVMKLISKKNMTRLTKNPNSSEHESISQVTNAAGVPATEAPAAKEAVKAVLNEPLDDIVNAVISEETKDFTNVLSVIKNLNSDQVLA